MSTFGFRTLAAGYRPSSRYVTVFVVAAAIVAATALSLTGGPARADESKGYPDIKVRKPNGGEIWDRGSKEKIRWRNKGFTGFNVRIELLHDGVFEREISPVTPNDGKFNWVVPDDVPLDNGYAVRIISITYPYIRDKSNDTFTIIDLP